MVRLHAASRPFPIFSAAAPLAPADPMLPGSFFACRRCLEDLGAIAARGHEISRLPQGRADRGVQNCAGRKGDDQKGIA